VNVFWSRCKEVFGHNIIIQRFVKTLRAREGGRCDVRGMWRAAQCTDDMTFSSQGGPRSGAARHSEVRRVRK
jgi:hypothetical protein